MTLDCRQTFEKLENNEVLNGFYKSLLEANLEKAIALSKEFIKSDDDIIFFWKKVIVSALYKIGSDWENGLITVGEEHTATSICQRVMAEHYSKIIQYIKSKEKILVITGSFELHEVGARMLSDLLEIEGFDTIFLNSKVSFDDIINTIYEEDVSTIIISSTIVSNIPKVNDLIEKIKATKDIKNMPIIIVGGQAYKKDKDARKNTKADYCITDINRLLTLLKRHNIVNFS